MENLVESLSIQKSSPHLWIERLAIFSQAEADQCIRSIEFRRGLNVIWAHEPAAGSAYTGIHAAGHGVGKTSLCLLMRFCLGDNAKSVNELREEVGSEFPHGGVGMVVHIANQTFAVFRFFNIYKDGFVANGNNIESLFTDNESQSFKDFEVQLAEAILSRVLPRTIPETGQAIEWKHILAWMTRDQGSRFKSFFAWREGEGTGLQRSRQDPPIIMRAVLGLMDQQESELLINIRALERNLETVQQDTERLQQEPLLIRRRIESELRTWLGLSDDLPLHSDDLFKESVEDKVTDARKIAEAKLIAADAELDKANEVLFKLRAEWQELDRRYQQADYDYQLANAARLKDEESVKKINEQRSKLQGLVGSCEHGSILFSECQYIQGKTQKLQAIHMKNHRDQSTLSRSEEEWAGLALLALNSRDALKIPLQNLSNQVSAKVQECSSLKTKRDSVMLTVDRGRRLLGELERWERLSGSIEAAEKIRQLISRRESISSDIDNKRLKVQMLKQKNSIRKKTLADITNTLTRKLLSEQAFGNFELQDESRPFQLSVRGGEAYRVLEVLLGDVVCLLDSVNPGSAFPGFLVHDCPREADMSAGLYDNFLLLLQKIEQKIFGGEAPFQYIVTTTTPPPAPIQSLPYLRVTLDPSTDDGLLFRRRFSTSLRSEYLQ
ncbi:hypothetical protein [Methylobacter svalbardensis]|uniref:hypothetical protein n=1 Tax=Methylobacter svalbardensis TaxID=3080016 RepID=UPI0030ECCA86